jgi:hypothetical protein
MLCVCHDKLQLFEAIAIVTIIPARSSFSLSLPRALMKVLTNPVSGVTRHTDTMDVSNDFAKNVMLSWLVNSFLQLHASCATKRHR